MTAFSFTNQQEFTMKNTPEFALATELLTSRILSTAEKALVIAHVMSGSEMPADMLNRVTQAIERSAILDTLDQDEAISALTKGRT